MTANTVLPVPDEGHRPATGETMPAYVMSAAGRLDLSHVAAPGPLQPGEVLLRTGAVGVCRTDVSHYAGLTSLTFPAVPGHELVGRVVEVGPGPVRDHVQEGQRLSYFGQTDFGGLAPWRVIRPLFVGMDAPQVIWDERGFLDADAAAACVVPDNLDDVTGVMAEPGCAVTRSLAVTPPPPGARVLVLGGGVTGQVALRMLRRTYAVESVDVLEINPYRRELARRHGARAALHPDDPAVDELLRGSQGAAADYVFDALPGALPAHEGGRVRTVACGLLKPGGTYNLFAAAESPDEHLPLIQILAKGLQVRGGAGFDERVVPMRVTAACLDRAVQLLADGTVQARDLVSHVVDFSDVAGVRAAFTEHARGERLKTVVTFPGA